MDNFRDEEIEQLSREELTKLMDEYLGTGGEIEVVPMKTSDDIIEEIRSKVRTFNTGSKY